MSTPISSAHEDPVAPLSNTLSDVFSDSPPPSPSASQPPEPSDIPRLRSTHVTAGYRDGISASKDQALQPGFDEAYPLGAIVGLKVGYILGALEGLCAMYGLPKDVDTDANSSDRNLGDSAESMRMRGLLRQAREELKVEHIFGKEYWKSDGNWAYETSSREEKTGKKDTEDEDVTFWEVADSHPLIRFWLKKIDEELIKSGIENAGEGFAGVGSGVPTRFEDLAT